MTSTRPPTTTPRSRRGGRVTDVAAQAPPNHLPADRLLVRPGADGVSLAVDAAMAGWRHLGFRVVSLGRGTTIDVAGDGLEHCVVLVSGPSVRVTSGGAVLELGGRATPFAGSPWAVYLPPDGSARISAAGSPEPTVLAIASAPGSARPAVATEARLIGPDDCRVEIRGAGNATRQITHIIPPEFPADRLLVVEVLTPAGNWSSWPPHKHDVEAGPAEAVLEEIYYYGFPRTEAWGLQRVYRRAGTPLANSSGPRDAIFAVRHGEVVLVTDGYHPFTATHGDDAWYLNALAGDRRSMACSFDPEHVDEMSAWTAMPIDPRVPFARVPAGERPPR